MNGRMTLEEKLRQIDALGLANKWDAATIERQKAKIRTQFADAPATRADGGARPGVGSRRDGRPAAQPRPKVDPNYLVSPYRFADLADAVSRPPRDVIDALGSGPRRSTLLSMPLAEGYCGSIDVEWEAETPLLIGEARKQAVGSAELEIAGPMRTGEGGDWWIPGSTFRGMVRAGCEIVGFGRLSQTNKHYVFSLRDFVHPHYSDPDNRFEGSSVAQAGAAKGGWLRYEEKENLTEGDSGYLIEPADLAYVDIEELLTSGYVGRNIGLQPWIESPLEAKYKAAGMIGPSRQIDFEKTPSGKPYRFSPAPPDAQGRRRVKPDPMGALEGTLLFANRTPPKGQKFDRRTAKKVEFVLLSKPGSQEPRALSQRAFERFDLVHTSPGRNEREPVGSWKILKPIVEAKHPIPIIYVGDLDKQDEWQFAFGLTRLFKIPHRYGVGDKLRNQKAHRLERNPSYQPDMVEALFGHVHEQRDYDVDTSPDRDDPGDALKGRVSFSGARITQTEAIESETMATVMMTPRASFAPFYLKGAIKDWSDEHAMLAGRKLYMPRATPNDLATSAGQIEARLRHQIAVLPPQARNNIKARSHLKFLRGHSGRPFRFKSRIDLHNVTKAEIGLLLFVLMHGGAAQTQCRHLIGRAKPFGAGQTRLIAARLNLVKNFRDGTAPADYKDYLDAFQAHMGSRETYNGADGPAIADSFPLVPAVQEWIGAADPGNGAALKGPQPPVSPPDDGSPAPGADTYLRLRYLEKGDRGSYSVNPYVNLRKATQRLKLSADPEPGRERLLPAPLAPKATG